MHDTFLNQNLYESILELCKEHSISKILKLKITVDFHSHLNGGNIRKQFAERNNALIGDFTNIFIEKKETEPLTATIEQIDGEILVL